MHLRGFHKIINCIINVSQEKEILSKLAYSQTGKSLSEKSKKTGNIFVGGDSGSEPLYVAAIAFIQWLSLVGKYNRSIILHPCLTLAE